MGGRLFRVEHVEADDEGGQQTLTLYGQKNETLKKVPRVQHFGLSSNPPVGSHGMGLQFGGDDGGRLLNAALGLEHAASRPRKLKPGQSTIYDQKGNVSRYLGDDGIWHDAQDRPQKITGKTVDLTATENASVSGKKVYLGGDGKTGTYAKVMTESGPSPFVYARIG